jgi:type I restriction enzyme S subunit
LNWDMSEWREECISEFADSFAGGTPSRSRSDYYNNGTIPWISSSEVNQPYIVDTVEKITQLGFENSSAKWVPKNSVLVAMYGATAGQVSKNLIDATSNQAVLALVPKKGKIEANFLYYQVKQNKDSILFLAQGSGQPNLSKDLIDRFKIKAPIDVDIQRKISQILITTDSVIGKTQEAIAKYKALKQGMLHDLFTRGIDINKGKLRPKREDAPELYKESKLGWVPKEWEVDILDKLCDVTSSKRIYMNEYVDFGIPFYRSLEIILKSKNEEVETTLYVSNEKYETIERQFGAPKCGDILITSVGTLGISYRVKENDLFYFKDGNLIWFRDFKSLEYSRFLLHSLNELIARQFDKITIGTSQKAFTIDKLKKLNVFLPKETEYKVISERIETFNNKLQTEHAYLQKLQQIKQGLMSDLLSGKKQVEVEEQISVK